MRLRARITRLAMGLVVGVLTAAGCGGNGGGETSGPAPQAVLTIFSSGADFGDVGVGNTTTLGLTFFNTGSAPLTLQQNSISGAGFTANGIGQGVTLNPGQYATLAVSFEPSAIGKSTGMVVLTSTTSNSPVDLSLSGNGVIVKHSTVLSWTPSKSTVVGYNVYRSAAAFDSWTKLNSSPIVQTAFTDWDVQAGTLYLYTVTSVSPTNVESPFSNAMQSTTPTP